MIGFAIGTGRCGTKLMSELMAACPGVSAHHELNPLNETFHRYCCWNQLPVDDEGFLACKEREILEAGEQLFFEASAHLSLSIGVLAQRFDARFVLMVRRPHRVVNSYIRKGWYTEPPLVGNTHLAIGYQPTPQFHHFLGRIMPHGDVFERWRGLTRVGKLAWFWRALNETALQTLETLPRDCWRVQRLEELDYLAFCELADFLGVVRPLSRQAFEAIAESRPNSFANVPTCDGWSELEHAEYIAELGDAPERFGYKGIPGE